MFLKRQEIVEFDPNNKAHRAAARAFLKRKAWVDSPLRFAHDTGYGSVAEQVQSKLLDWYVAQEEAKESKKNGNKNALAFLDEVNSKSPHTMEQIYNNLLLGNSSSEDAASRV